jgi:catechol 2,3-dioxygenase-like lactoylglutathione lyase family enzyme
MIQSDIGHIQFNIDPRHNTFYRDLFQFLGWAVWYDEPTMVGVGNQRGGSLWFSGTAKAVANDYDGPGVNHVAISVAAQADVDQVAAYLKQRAVPALFETPRHRPDFSSSGETYYQVMFESPDRILFEVVYTGPLQEG